MCVFFVEKSIAFFGLLLPFLYVKKHIKRTLKLFYSALNFIYRFVSHTGANLSYLRTFVTKLYLSISQIGGAVLEKICTHFYIQQAIKKQLYLHF